MMLMLIKEIIQTTIQSQISIQIKSLMVYLIQNTIHLGTLNKVN